MELKNLNPAERQAISDRDTAQIEAFIKVRQEKEVYIQNEKKRIRDLNQAMLGGYRESELHDDIKNIIAFNKEHNSYLELMRKTNMEARRTLKLHLQQIENQAA